MYSFAHLTFQEYFTAKYIMKEKQRVADLVTQHFNDKRWREVFFLVVSGLDNADGFFQSFKQAMDNLIKQDRELVALLQWADKKALAVETSHKIGAVRSFYFFLAYDRARALALALDRALDRALALDLDLARSFDLALALALDLDLARSFDLDRARDLARDLDRALDRSLNLDLDLDLSIDYLLRIALQVSLIFEKTWLYPEIRSKALEFKKFFSEVVNRCNSLPSLSQALQSLSVPNSQSKPEAWEKFANELRIIMQRERNIGHEWNLTKKQVDTLETYLRANLFMLECLKLAAVSDRKAIEDSVLLPPVV